MKRWIRFAVMLQVLLQTRSLVAHDVTLFPELSGHQIRVSLKYGDPGDYEPAFAVKLLELDAFAPDGKKLSFRDGVKADGVGLLTTGPNEVKQQDGTWLIASRYDNGFYVHTADGRPLATTKLDFPAAKDSAHYFKFSKALLRIGHSSPGAERVIGHRLELVPHVDPFSLKPGDHLPIEVLFDGKPLAGVPVEVGDDKAAAIGELAKTDGTGIVQLPIRSAGWYRIAVDRRVPSHFPELFAEDDYTATLTFFLEP